MCAAHVGMPRVLKLEIRPEANMKHRRLQTVVLQCMLVSVCLLMFGCEGFFTDPKVVSIAVTPPTPSLVTGAAQQFSATATYDDGSTKVLNSAVWSSSNAAILFVNSAGMATAVGAGSATISASFQAGTGSTTATVVTSPLTALQILPVNPSISVSVQKTQQFSAIATFADGSTKDISSSVTWSSSNQQVATINSIGLATAKNVTGTTTIQASSGQVNASTTLTAAP